MSTMGSGTQPGHQGAVAGLLSRMSCDLQGWIIGWAVIIFASAALQAGVSANGPDVGALFTLMLDVADAVPPIGKLTLGGLFALTLLVTSRVRQSRLGAALIPSLAGAGAMAATLLLPVRYYPASIELSIGIHLLAGAAGGAMFAAARTTCRRRKEARS